MKSTAGSRAPPQLDENSLSLSFPEGAGNSFTLVMPNGEFASSPNAAATPRQVESPSTVALLQRQQAVAAARLEQEYVHTRMQLQQCPRGVLLSILTSLMDEYPSAFVTPIRMKLEQSLAQQRPAVSSPASSTQRSTRRGSTPFVPNSNATPWTPQSHSASTTPFQQGGSQRRGRGSHKSRDEDQDLCSVHNSMRALKHLHLNASTGLFECIHGFHCLVDGPAEPTATAKSVSNESNGTSQPMSANSYHAGYMIRTNNGNSSASPYPPLSPSSNNNNNNNNNMGNGRFKCDNNNSYIVVGSSSEGPTTAQWSTAGPSHASGASLTTPDMDEDMHLDVHSLANLLLSVQAMDREGGL